MSANEHEFSAREFPSVFIRSVRGQKFFATFVAFCKTAANSVPLWLQCPFVPESDPCSQPFEELITKEFPSLSLKVAKVPQHSFLGGASNSTPLPESSPYVC